MGASLSSRAARIEKRGEEKKDRETVGGAPAHLRQWAEEAAGGGGGEGGRRCCAAKWGHGGGCRMGARLGFQGGFDFIRARWVVGYVPAHRAASGRPVSCLGWADTMG